MEWLKERPTKAGYYLLDCRPYEDSEASWLVVAFFRGDHLAIFDPRGMNGENNIEIPLDEANVRAWCGPIAVPERM